MIKNDLTDLNNFLFAQLEKLDDPELLDNPDKLELELKRTKAVNSIASNIISNANTVLDAAKFKDGAFENKPKLPMMLECGNSK